MSVDKGMKILVVDDFKTMRRIVINLLSQLGFNIANITEAIDGESALLAIEEAGDGDGAFQLIISDWNMEPMDGLDFLQKLRAQDGHYKKVPFIMVTAESKPENIIKAKQCGVDNYIVKPFNAETLKQKLVMVLGNF